MSAVEILDDVLDRYRAEMIDREASLERRDFREFQRERERLRGKSSVSAVPVFTKDVGGIDPVWH